MTRAIGGGFSQATRSSVPTPSAPPPQPTGGGGVGPNTATCPAVHSYLPLARWQRIPSLTQVVVEEAKKESSTPGAKSVISRYLAGIVTPARPVYDFAVQEDEEGVLLFWG